MRETLRRRRNKGRLIFDIDSNENLAMAIKKVQSLTAALSTSAMILCCALTVKPMFWAQSSLS